MSCNNVRGLNNNRLYNFYEHYLFYKMYKINISIYYYNWLALNKMSNIEII